MSRQTKKVVIVSASPRASDKTATGWLAGLGESRLCGEGLEACLVNVRRSLLQGKAEQEYETMLRADALVIIFPLYFFCLPGMLMRFLQEYQAYAAGREAQADGQRVYAVVNCGFPEPGINGEAIRVIRSFSQKTGAAYRFGVLIGGGSLLTEAVDAPFMKKTAAAVRDAFDAMKTDILEEGKEQLDDIAVPVNFPRRLYFFMGNRGWIAGARKNGLKKSDLYRQTYRE